MEVSTSDAGYAQVIKALKLKPKLVGAPSCTMRFFTPIEKIRQIIKSGKIGQPLIMTHHLGMYLPDWHPWEDYRKFYVSHKESSAIKEMIPYELQWLEYLIGDKFISAQGRVIKLSNLEMSAPDTSAAILQTKSGLMLSLVVEVLARTPLRLLRIIGSEGSLEWHWQAWEIKYYQVKTKRWTTIKLKPETKRKEYAAATEEMYVKEMAAFLAALKGKAQYPYSFNEDLAHFKLLKRIEV